MGVIPQQTWIYAALMLLAGFGIPIMAALNGGLIQHLQGPATVSSILLSIDLPSGVAITLFTISHL